MGQRPYKRICPQCGREYKSRSGGRMYCYTCSPPQIIGRPREDGQISGTGVGRKSNMVKPEENPCIPNDDLDRGIRELAESDYGDKVGDGKTNRGRNKAGEDVKLLERPKLGWGRCRHVDPQTNSETCDSERFSDTTPFCRPHIEFWRDRRAAMKAKKMAEDESAPMVSFTEKDFAVSNPNQAKKLLARINYGVATGQILPGKARAMKELIVAQVRAMDSDLLHKKLKKALKKGSSDPDNDDIGGEEAKDLADMASELGIGDDEPKQD